jgi:signal transduction histidine kinase
LLAEAYASDGDWYNAYEQLRLSSRARQRQQEFYTQQRQMSRQFLTGQENAESLLFLAHGIRGPMSTIIAIADHADPLRKKPEMENLRLAAEKVLRLIEGYQHYTRALFVDRENDETISIVSLLDQCTERLEKPAANKRVKLAMKTAVDCLVKGDYELLFHAFLKVLSNALEASPTDSTVTVSLDVLGDHCVLTVRDHGPGLPAKRVQNPFEYRVPDFHGKETGLGLPFVARAARRHDGRVSATRASDGATEIVFVLPLVGTSPDIGDLSIS